MASRFPPTRRQSPVAASSSVAVTREFLEALGIAVGLDPESRSMPDVDAVIAEAGDPTDIAAVTQVFTRRVRTTQRRAQRRASRDLRRRHTPAADRERQPRR